MSLSCPYCKSTKKPSDSRALAVRAGYFLRRIDQQRLQRYLCKVCERTFSQSTRNPCFRQKKRHLNRSVFQLLASGVSQRRAAFLLKTNRKTVIRKYFFTGLCALQVFNVHRAQQEPAREVEFDDLETMEHSKLKPLSVIMMVESKTRRILGFRVAKMPAKGLLVKRALKKYGPRPDERKQKREELFSELRPFVAENAIIRSDESPHYPGSVAKFFPGCVHLTSKGQRGCVVGQGELKAGGFDPIFSLNHTFAMMRANVNRLFRRTWNTTKLAERLSLHLMIYALYHNLFLVHNPAR